MPRVLEKTVKGVSVKLYVIVDCNFGSGIVKGREVSLAEREEGVFV